jgi:hypothetical protein
MILLNNGYAIDADANGGYTLGIPKTITVTDKKTGEVREQKAWTNPTYPTTLNGALKSYRKRLQRELIDKSEDMTLAEAIRKMEELDKKLALEVKEYGFKMVEEER